MAGAVKAGASAGRFAYVNLILQNAPGVIAKLAEQAEAARRRNLGMDVVWLTRGLPGEIKESGLIIRNMGPGSRLQCRVRQMKALRAMQDAYDGILLRYPLCDPVTLFGLPAAGKIASEHHTKEVPELRMSNDPRVFTESLFGGRFLRRFSSFFAVTDEILDYERTRVREHKPGFVTYNAISTARFPASARQSGLFRQWPILRFVAASPVFSAWQGLDLILEGFARENTNCELHLCGEVPEELRKRAAPMKNVILHGRLDRAGLLEVYARCDVGVASFGIHRKALSQATTLKVREYLACGLPVVLGHDDPGIPPGFPYALRAREFHVREIRDWCSKLPGTTRQDVFQKAEPLISVDTLVEKQISGLRQTFQSDREEKNPTGGP
jgi:glycosyltransferase involved in cell wall biosynthesis